MKSRSKVRVRRFQLKILAYGNSYYIDRIGELEALLARKPRWLQLELIGEGEIPADLALLIRSVLMARSPKTFLSTYARSSLQGGSVLVWLMGERRMIRDDARLYLRRVEMPEEETTELNQEQPVPAYQDSFTEIEPEEADYARMLLVINEFLPVRELAGRFIRAPVLKQFGLIANEQVDRFLADVFGKAEPAPVSRRMV
jgi:hypothetical protein